MNESQSDFKLLLLKDTEVEIGDVMLVSVAMAIAAAGVLVVVEGDVERGDCSGPALAVMARREDRRRIWVVWVGRCIFVLVGGRAYG